MTPVLFLCTGNYYRSRYAEILFNYHAGLRGAPLRADSRGIMVDVYGVFNTGPIASMTLARMQQRGIACPTTGRSPRQLELADLSTARLVVALKEGEHRPMMRERFPEWVDRITYWDIDDVHDGPVEQALNGIEQEIERLLERLITPAQRE